MTTILNFRDHKPVVELSNTELIAKCNSIGAIAPHSKTSNKYSFIPTIEAVNYLRDAGFVPVSAKQGRTQSIEKNGFQQHVITFTNTNLDLGNRRIQMNLYNSHDGGSSYILSGGLYRLVCANGLVVGSNQAEFRHRHIGFDADLFIESAKFVAQRMGQIVARLQKWEDIELSPLEQGIFAQAAHEVLYDGKSHRSVFPEQLLIARRYEDKKNNLWSTFNRIQENVIKGGLRGTSKSGRRSKTRGITNIKKDKIINQSLWSMAEHISEVKLNQAA